MLCIGSCRLHVLGYLDCPCEGKFCFQQELPLHRLTPKTTDVDESIPERAVEKCPKAAAACQSSQLCNVVSYFFVSFLMALIEVEPL